MFFWHLHYTRPYAGQVTFYKVQETNGHVRRTTGQPVQCTLYNVHAVQDMSDHGSAILNRFSGETIILPGYKQRRNEGGGFN